MLRHAYLNLSVSPRTAMYLLIGSLIGGYFNIPIADLSGEPVVSNQVITSSACNMPCRGSSTHRAR